MYGILRSAENTGSEAELTATFSTPLSIISNVPGFALDTVNLKRRTSSSTTQRWEIEAAISPTNDSGEYFAHSIVNRTASIIYVRMPQLYIKGHGANGISKKTPVGAPMQQRFNLTVDAGMTAGSSRMNVAGLGRYDLMVGEFITFDNDTKVYVIVEAGIRGVGAVIFPSLRKYTPKNTVITYGDRVTMAAYYDDNGGFGIRYLDGVMTDPGSVKLLEAL